MSRQRTLSYFSTQTHDGIDLRERIELLVQHLGFKMNPIVREPTQATVAHACWQDDVVIFDGSIEDEGHNYEIAFEPLKGMLHALIISRTPLPLNFLGLRTGSAPAYPASLNNDTIYTWLEGVLPSMPSRSWSEKGMALQVVAQSRAFKWAVENRKEQGKIFISYRSRYEKAVQRLRSQIREGTFHQGRPQTMFFFPPGSLAFEDEIMAAMRRWQILSIIRDYIYDCEEFWIYKTDDYLDSWWTRGELATFVYGGGANKHIRLYNEEQNTVRDVQPEELPVLTKEEHDRMARWFANTDPMTMGAESTIILGSLANTHRSTIPFFNDPVWKVEFQHYPVMQCSSEQCNQNRRVAPEQLTFDMNSLLWMHEDNLFPVEDSHLEHIVQTGEPIACPRCGTCYKVIREPLDRYLYLALPVGTGPKGKNLQSLPVYRAQRM